MAHYQAINDDDDDDGDNQSTFTTTTSASSLRRLHSDQEEGAGAGVSISFEHIVYSVAGRDAPLLDGVSGLVRPGQCCAVLGGSGSGKTTLLDVLAGMIPDGPNVQGTVRFGKTVINAAQRRLVSAYVMQDDRLLPSLTVRQTFWYAAALRRAKNDRMQSRDEVRLRVEAAIDDLGLRKVADTSIGGVFSRGISGGERRRVSVGIQLLTNPSVLFLDEPTTGLDAFNAYALIETLSALARSNNKTILFTIHQPRSNVFELLDGVMLLSNGKGVYQGPAAALGDHFTACGFPSGRFVNLLDHAIDLVVVDKRSPETEDATTERLNGLVKAYQASALYKQLEVDLAEVGGDDNAAASSSHIPVVTGYNKSTNNVAWAVRKFRRWVYTFTTVLARQFTNLGRNPIALGMRMAQLIAIGSILSMFILRLDNNQSSVQNRSGLLYQAMMSGSFVGMLTAIPLFPEHRDLFYRERRQGFYNAGTMLLAYVVHVLPTALIAVTVASSIVYFGTGLYPETSRFFVFAGVIFFGYLFGELLAIMFMGVFYSPVIANTSSALYMSVASLISTSVFRSYERMPDVVRWVSYSSIYKYASQILIVNEFQDLRLTCDDDEPCRYPSGNFYLELYYPNAVENVARNWALVIVFVGVMGVSAALVLQFRKRSMR